MAKYKVKNTTILHDGVSRGEDSVTEGQEVRVLRGI